MEFTHKIPCVEAYNQLRVNAGMNSTKPHSEVKKALVICTPFTGQTSKGGIYYALLIRVQNEMCRIISTRNMGRNA